MQYFPAFEPLVDRAEFVALLEETGLYEWPGRAGDPTEGSMNVHLTAGSWSTAARPTSWGLCSSSAPLRSTVGSLGALGGWSITTLWVGAAGRERPRQRTRSVDARGNSSPRDSTFTKRRDDLSIRPAAGRAR
jgi:hypothetical protein